MQSEFDNDAIAQWSRASLAYCEVTGSNPASVTFPWLAESHVHYLEPTARVELAAFRYQIPPSEERDKSLTLYPIELGGLCFDLSSCLFNSAGQQTSLVTPRDT